ncbi:hypothetical protein AGOR_G00120260 [Albula goreensis]|uniref:Uncharacterized protein n=1 Tax=Albula goreensis TaxID=1534307 RepID=A0A8T3DKQ1_9TELE|nr:hypothetical protein AGOR_G00120260 [Albula goreensis]
MLSCVPPDAACERTKQQSIPGKQEGGSVLLCSRAVVTSIRGYNQTNPTCSQKPTTLWPQVRLLHTCCSQMVTFNKAETP